MLGSRICHPEPKVRVEGVVVVQTRHTYLKDDKELEWGEDFTIPAGHTRISDTSTL